jgi:predicted aspartyl protease
VEFQNKPFRCFTTRANGLVNVLKNDILVSDAYDPRSGDPAPQSKQFVGLWDTGATGSVIQKRVADDLGLSPSGRVVVHGVGKDGTPNEFETNSYLINIHLPNQVALVAVKVSEGTISGADILIGMDVIGCGDFVITNFNGKTTWSFRVPSGEEVDFVKDLDDYNRKYKNLLMSDDQKRKERNRLKRQRQGREKP